jgi:hypothetical protein
VFREIGNALGFYYEANFSFQNYGYMGMAHILIGLNLSVGLADKITIQNNGSFYQRALDNLGIPFICGICDIYGHFVKDFSREEKHIYWVKNIAVGDEKENPSIFPE